VININGSRLDLLLVTFMMREGGDGSNHKVSLTAYQSFLGFLFFVDDDNRSMLLIVIDGGSCIRVIWLQLDSCCIGVFCHIDSFLGIFLIYFPHQY